MNAIETAGLTKEYVAGWGSENRLLALDDLTLNVPAGAIFGFLGPNGAGKSTTIKLLLGLITPTRGLGMMMGIPVHDKRARERVGFLPEEPAFCSYLRADEFLDLCGRMLRMDRASRRKRSAELLDIVGLSAKKRVKLAEFSRGMMQRIGLAQALMNAPDLVVLDEPLNGLDPYGRKELKAILQNQKTQGKTVFFSSHILSDVQEMCDEIGILNRGRLVTRGRLSELLQTCQVTLRVPELEMTTVARLEPLSNSIARTHRHWDIQLKQPGLRDEACSALRQAGHDEIEVQTRTESLEEFFFRRIGDDDQARGFNREDNKP